MLNASAIFCLKTLILQTRVSQILNFNPFEVSDGTVEGSKRSYESLRKTTKFGKMVTYQSKLLIFYCLQRPHF